MADFTGMIVKVVLKDPPNLVLHGQVKEVIAGQTLALQDVLVPSTGARLPSHTVLASAIADLQVITAAANQRQPYPAQPSPPPPQQHSYPRGPDASRGNPAARPPQGFVSQAGPQPRPRSNNQTPIAPQPASPPRSTVEPNTQPSSSFVDPAILSYGKSPAPSRTIHPPDSAPKTPIKSVLSKAAENLPTTSSPFVGEAKSSDKRQKPEKKEKFQATVSDANPLDYSGLQADQDGVYEIGQEGASKKKRTRKSAKKAQTSTAPHDPPPIMNVDVSRNGNDMDGAVKRGKGWRQTPLLQPSQTPSVHGPESTPKARNKRDKRQENAQNGWATEDATDVQELGDFDFEANHKLFDKKQVFDQLRQGDTTAEEDLLVSHNKVHRPGTYGGKNLHPTENVLSPTLEAKGKNDELDTSSEADTEVNLLNGRSSSRHSASRASVRRQQSRQSSTHLENRPHPLASSISTGSGLGIKRSMTSLSGKAGNKGLPSVQTSLPDRTMSPLSANVPHKTPNIPTQAAAGVPMPYLAVQSTNEQCPVLLPDALETLEHEAVSRYGLSQEAITETAARSIAEMALNLSDSAADFRRPSRTNTAIGRIPTSQTPDPNSNPVVVIMAGNHATGARAIAAARHLVHRKVSIIVAEGPYDSPESQDIQARVQTTILKRLQKSGAPIKRGSWRKASQYIKSLSGPPAIIIDALLAGTRYDPTSDGAPEIRDMIDWANRSRASVLSLACPSGVYGVDGTTTTVEGEPLAVRSDAVLCLAAPLQGLLFAMKDGERWDDVRLADVGVNVALRSDEAVPFGSAWVVRLVLVDAAEQGGNAV